MLNGFLGNLLTDTETALSCRMITKSLSTIAMLLLLTALLGKNIEKKKLEIGQELYVKAKVLRYRTKPSLKGKKAGTLRKGDMIRFFGFAGKSIKVGKMRNQWVKFRANRKWVYTYAGFLSIEEVETELEDGEDPGVNPEWGCFEYDDYHLIRFNGNLDCSDKELKKIFHKAKNKKMKLEDAYADSKCEKAWAIFADNCRL